jgi:hypothetical protein
MKTKQLMNAVQNLAPNDPFIPGVAQSVTGRPLTMQDSLPIKAAEYWLELGKADLALRELEALPSNTGSLTFICLPLRKTMPPRS